MFAGVGSRTRVGCGSFKTSRRTPAHGRRSAVTSARLLVAGVGTVGGGVGTVGAGPMSTRAVMIVLMWIGRIEIIPVLVLFTRAFWMS